MTITREQLELAALAAGYSYTCWIGDLLEVRTGKLARFFWNPLTDHGQLHDLAMACKIELMPMTDEICYAIKGAASFRFVRVNCQDFPALAVAVITAAAEQQLAREKLMVNCEITGGR